MPMKDFGQVIRNVGVRASADVPQYRESRSEPHSRTVLQTGRCLSQISARLGHGFIRHEMGNMMRGRQSAEGVPGVTVVAAGSPPPPTPRGPRFDPAHSSSGHALDDVVTPPRDVLQAIAGQSAEVAAEQLQAQAAELSEHLRRRHRELTRWEATLNARAAQYDDEQRAARLWLREQQSDLAGREADCRRLQRLLEERAATLEATGPPPLAAPREREQPLDEAFAQQRRLLELEVEQVRRQAAALETAYQDWQLQCRQEQQALGQLREQLEDQRRVAEQLNTQLRERIAEYQRSEQDADHLTRRRRALDLQETALREAEAALEQQRQTLFEELHLRQQRTAQQRSAIASQWRGRLQALKQQRQVLEQHRHALSRQHASLDQQQQELDSQRQEMALQRLTLQHAEAVIERRAAPHDIRHLAQVVQQYVHALRTAAEQKLAIQRQELQGLAAGLLRQEQSLKMRHARMQAQIAARQAELDAQTAQLAEREQAISRRECELLSERGTSRTGQS